MAIGIKETNCDIATHVMRCRHYVTKYCLLNRKVYNHETIACDEKDDSQRQYLVLIIFWWNVYQNRIQLKWYKYFKLLLISKVCLRDFIFRQWQDLDSLVFGFLLLANISSQHIILYVIVFTKRCFFQSHELDYITSTDSS